MKELDCLLEHTENLFFSSENLVKNFKKNTYADLFENFRSSNSSYFGELNKILNDSSQEDTPLIFSSISEAIIECNKKGMENAAKKDRFQYQMNRNMFMAVYLLPAIRTISHPIAKDLSEYIAAEWGKNFKDSNIVASDYEGILAGFHRKLCYITTAVCHSLNKAEDCDELRLIKGFRDNQLRMMPGGSELISEYYNIAPTLVKRIQREEDAESIYVFLYDKFIAPCVHLIKEQKFEECRDIYVTMITMLRKKYMED